MTRKRRRGTRERILDAAEMLLRRHGLVKTTVVDVARALGMSHANVYRHFASKAELHDALIERWLRQVWEPLTKTAERPGPAAERLEDWVMTFVTASRRKALHDPELFAAYHAATEAARDPVEAHLARGRAQLARIIRRGIDGGEFAVTSPNAAAAAVMDAMLRFWHPYHVRESADRPITRQARRVLGLLIAGLRAGAP
jgi:AcrR family transcriptional regulator